MKNLAIASVVSWVMLAPCFAGDWDRFRGPNGSGSVSDTEIPWTWSSEKSLKWKSPLPGKGASSPVVSGDRIYLTCYTGYGVDPANPGNPQDLVRHLLALDRQTGYEIWRKSIPSNGDEDPYQGFITQHGYASSSPVTDGEHVYVLLGKSGLFAFDRDGNQTWHVDLGQKSDSAKWGDGTSPILVGDLIVVDAGILGNHFVGINKDSGEKAWSLEDPAFTNCWATPIEVRVGDQTQVLFNVPKQVIAVDPVSGEKLWSAASPLDDAACSSIVSKDGSAYLMGSRAGNALALTCGGSGDVSQTNTIWQTKLRSGICTPVIVGDNMYWTTGGIFYAASLANGEYVYKERLPRLGGPTGGFPNADYSSPIAVGDKVIQFTRNGESYVIQAGNEFVLIAHNPSFADDRSAFSATPAVSDGELFMRSDSFLYCISSE